MDAIQIHASILFKLKKRIGNNMNLQHITILTLFIEGLLSFFSPCVLPILPVYIGILAGQGEEKQSGETIWDRRKVFTNTFLFILLAALLVNFFKVIFNFFKIWAES